MLTSFNRNANPSIFARKTNQDNKNSLNINENNKIIKLKQQETT